jgi:hypothetical protein
MSKTKKVKRVVLGEGYPMWHTRNPAYGENAYAVSLLNHHLNPEVFQEIDYFFMPFKGLNNGKRIRLIAEIIE